MATIKALTERANSILSSKSVSSFDALQIEGECKKHLTSINGKLNMCINMFNTVINDMCSTLSQSFPNDPTITTYAEVVSEIITESPLEPISLFILYIYKDPTYRKSIAEGNEDFFVNNDHSGMTKGDSDKVATMFQFKSSWKNFNGSQKDYIKNATKMLLKVAETYIIEKDDGNKVADVMAKFAKVQTI
jgi:hypothetical protein